MKFKKLSHVLIFCFGVMLLLWVVGRGLYDSLVVTISSGKPEAIIYFLNGIKNFMVALIGIFILKKIGKINILKDKGKGFWRGILIGIIPAVFIVVFLIFIPIMSTADSPAGIRWNSWEVIMSFIFQCFSVGVLEEIYFRGIIFNVIDDYFGHRNACEVWKTVVLSGFLFGLAHLVISEGMSGFVSSLSQSIGCIGIGIFFGAVYMRCRNIYSLMIVHALYDIVGSRQVFMQVFIVNNNLVESGASQNFDLMSTMMSTIITLIIYIPVAMFLLRKKKMAEIINSEPNKLSLDPKCS